MSTSAAIVRDPVAEPARVAALARPRLDSLDLVRGVVMVLMALDHARDFFTNVRFEPTDLSQASAALFLTRWVTHFCAPVFVFLAGTGAYLSAWRGKTPRQVSWFLFTRGLWLVLLELTVVRFGWLFNVDYRFSMGQVIWAIGWSMVALSALVFLPTGVVTAFGLVMIATHNLFDGVTLEDFGRYRWIWAVLHVPVVLTPAPDHVFFTAYPLVPWIGVMAAGYGFGALYRLDAARRRRTLAALGASLILAFVALRFLDVYGDPLHWARQKSAVLTVLSFLNCQKYPPSLLYLLMTLGPAILALAFLERPAGALGRPFVVFGRVPLFYYLLHVPFIHLLAAVYAISAYGPAVLAELSPLSAPPNWGFDLPVVYAVWAGAVVALYPPCRWFAGVKQRRRDAWLSYL